MQENDNDDSDASDDMVILGGGSYYKEMKWRFPQTKQCPHIRCNKTFPSRALAIQHYREEHAKDFTFCVACDKPFNARHFEEHKQTSTHRLSLTTSKTLRISIPVDLFFCSHLPNIDLKQSFEFNFFLHSNQKRKSSEKIASQLLDQDQRLKYVFK